MRPPARLEEIGYFHETSTFLTAEAVRRINTSLTFAIAGRILAHDF
jgi:hypothetical protein